MPERKPIFYDEERRRWRRTRLALEIAGGLFTLVLIVFLLNVGRQSGAAGNFALQRRTPGLRASSLATAARERFDADRQPQSSVAGQESRRITIRSASASM